MDDRTNAATGGAGTWPRRAALRAAATGAAGVLLVAAAGTARAGVHGGWQRCRRCRGLFWGAGRPCPAGGTHAADESRSYLLTYDGTAGPNEESNWRACATCGLLAWQAGGPCVGDDPFGEGPPGHEASERIYRLAYNRPVGAGEEGGWRWCTKCQTLFKPQGRRRGVCAAGGSHKAGANYAYVLRLLTDW